ncbi:MAG: Unknown protein [uncultured Campylobacterales bacterium]|uniref:Prepilin-type N-terminal cleavage/methylation domain-containing protein n=1 Tax=uncultured Campylobacterales bacterium TaxID=352960 RepID=A0A6S6THG3_9BACT|nr:MAG: Unknown protein [uncultured Campylobacterales bacterium]
MKYNNMKKGFSLIELLFSIVIISLTIFTLPMLMTSSNKSDDISTTSDMIYAIESNIYATLTYKWDENGQDGIARNKVLKTNSTAIGLNEVNSTNYRIGHVIGNTRRSFHKVPLNASNSLTLEGTVINDIDDFNDKNISMSKSIDIDYLNNFDVTTKVSYVEDNDASDMYQKESIDFTLGLTPTTSSTNIKEVSITAYSSDKNLSINMKAYSSNIGEGTYVYTRW